MQTILVVSLLLLVAPVCGGGGIIEINGMVKLKMYEAPRKSSYVYGAVEYAVQVCKNFPWFKKQKV